MKIGQLGHSQPRNPPSRHIPIKCVCGQFSIAMHWHALKTAEQNLFYFWQQVARDRDPCPCVWWHHHRIAVERETSRVGRCVGGGDHVAKKKWPQQLPSKSILLWLEPER